MTLGKRINAKRKERRLTQAQLADMAGICPQTLMGYEYDKSVPNLFIAADIARALGVSLEWLATGREVGGC